MISSCSLSGVKPTEGIASLIEGVPFYPQLEYQCGPASLAGVLGFLGYPDSPEEIAEDVYSPTARGTLGIDLQRYAESKGLRTRLYTGSMDDIRSSIDAKVPVIVLVQEGFSFYPRNHFMVVVGYGKDFIVVNSGLKEHEYVPMSEFVSKWKNAGNQTLLVTK